MAIGGVTVDCSSTLIAFDVDAQSCCNVVFSQKNYVNLIRVLPLWLTSYQLVKNNRALDLLWLIQHLDHYTTSLTIANMMIKTPSMRVMRASAARNPTVRKAASIQPVSYYKKPLLPARHRSLSTQRSSEKKNSIVHTQQIHKPSFYDIAMFTLKWKTNVVSGDDPKWFLYLFFIPSRLLVMVVLLF